MFQALPCFFCFQELLFVAEEQTKNEPLEVWIQKNKVQLFVAYDRFWASAFGTISGEPVGIEKNQPSYVGPSRFGVSLSLVDCVLDDGPGVSTTGDDGINMKVEALVIT